MLGAPAHITIEIPRRSARARVVLADGEVIATTSVDVVEAIGLEDGDTTSAEVALRQIRDAEPETASQRALRLLDYKERTVAGLAGRLAEDGYAAHVVGPLVERLADLGLVDDARFAEMFVRAKRSAGWGRRRILDGLKRAGVPEDLALECAREDDAGAEYERAFLLATRKRPRTREDAARVAASLARRGFSFDTARSAAEQAMKAVLDES